VLALANLEPGEQVLDVACGTGLVTFRAAESVGSRGRVVGTDISDVMVEQVRRSAARRGLMQVTAERRDAEELELGEVNIRCRVVCAGAHVRG